MWSRLFSPLWCVFDFPKPPFEQDGVAKCTTVFEAGPRQQTQYWSSGCLTKTELEALGKFARAVTKGSRTVAAILLWSDVRHERGPTSQSGIILLANLTSSLNKPHLFALASSPQWSLFTQEGLFSVLHAIQLDCCLLTTVTDTAMIRSLVFVEFRSLPRSFWVSGEVNICTYLTWQRNTYLCPKWLL